MNNFKHLKKVLFKSIEMMNDVRSLFVENPVTDFTRERKLPFDTVIKNVICFEGGSMNDEMLKSFHYSIDAPSVSAMIQARDKIKVDAFKTLFDRFNEKTKRIKTYKGYRLLAVDGCEIPIDNTIYDRDTTVMMHSEKNTPYSAFHLNPVYDLLEHTYDDLIIQGQAKMNENGAFCDLVDRYKGKQAIFITDRGYESYNGFEHVARSGNKYLVRVKDIGTKTGMPRSPVRNVEAAAFDIDVSRILTRRYTNEIKNNPDIYKFCPKKMRFDYMDKKNPYYEFNCRIVQFKIMDDSYETIITNLDRDTYGTKEIKHLYELRWGIETSFKLIKYALDMNAFHSKKRK